MFIDNLAILLVNMAAGFFLLGYYIYRGLDEPNQRRWAPGFAIVGFVALAVGLHMLYRWPLPSSFNVAFGEPTVLFGALFLGAALALALGWDLLSVSVYALFAGIAAVVIGARIVMLKLTQTPGLAGAGFIISGVLGIVFPAVLYLRTNIGARAVFAIVAVIAALIWAFIGYEAFWGHIVEFAKWAPK